MPFHGNLFIVKRTDRTPKTTTITFTFPDGQTVYYQSDNVFLRDFTKGKIVEKRLFPYIPFYIARYEKEIASEGDIEKAVEELTYFRDEMVRLHQEGVDVYSLDESGNRLKWGIPVAVWRLR